MALETVTKMIGSARVLLQDTLVEYRHSDAVLLDALNTGLIEAYRIRPDLFLFQEDGVPAYTVVNTTAIAIDQQFLPALLYFIVGHVTLQDEEGEQDSRAERFISKFTGKLLAVAA